jgi:ell wall binding domain 2 (CWB2)
LRWKSTSERPIRSTGRRLTSQSISLKNTPRDGAEASADRAARGASYRAPQGVTGGVHRSRLAVAAASAAVVLGGCGLGDQPSGQQRIGAKASDKSAAAKLGFPFGATRNTVRVGGGDATTDAAGVASALFPATSKTNRPTAVVLVDQGSWQDALSASVLAGPPISAPILLSDGGKLPPVTKETLSRLNPKGSDLSKDAQVIRIGEGTARPSGLRTAVIAGADPYERAAAIDRFFSAVRGKASPDVLVVSGDKAEFALPAAALASRAGDSVLPVKHDSVPGPIRKALRAHSRPNIYVLGPAGVIGPRVAAELARLGTVRRIQAPNAVQNAIAFARYKHGRFGWGVVVPGFNFTLANTSRSAEAAAAASLATRGVYAPLLLTDRADRLPRQLDEYLRAVQPGYESDPGDAVYNRVWLLGDGKAISLAQQARVDEITELVPVQPNAP